MADHMYDFARLSRRQRIILRNRTERLSDLLDWKNLGVYYQQARTLVMRRTHPERAAPVPLRTSTTKELNLHFPRPPSAVGSPSLSRQVGKP